MLLQKTNAGNLTPFWNTSRANKLLDLSADIDALKQYRVEINANKSQTEAMEIAMGNASQSAKDMAEGWDLSRGALNRWSASQKAAIKQTGFFKSAIASLKGVMASLGAMFINMAVMFAVTEGINLIIKGIDALITTADEAKEAAADLASSWKETDDTLASHKKTLDGIAAEYASLSKGVDSFGNNVSLTSDEFSRYNDLANQIADMFPELVSGWTDENNAILTTRGSVQALTDAYTALTDEQNRVKAAALESTLSTFKDAEMQIPVLAWKDTGSQLQASLAKQLLDAMSSGTINDLASTLGDDQLRILHDIMENAYGYSGVTPLWNALDDIIGDPKTLRAYYDKLITEMETTVRNVQDSISGILSSSDIYKNFDSSTKALISQIVQGIDNNFVAGFAGQDNAEIALRKWINDNLIDVFSGYDFSQIIDIKNLFDSSQISTGTYQKYYTNFIKSIEGFAPEIQTALGEAFDPDVSNLITNVQEKLLDEYDDQVFTLTLNELQIAANLDIADASWEELQSSISTTSALAAQAITDLTEDLTGLVGVYELIATAISEQNTSGYVTVETYQALIAANQDYANSFEVVNGQLQFNADSAYKLADAMSEIQLKEAQAGKDARRSAIDENLEQIEEYNKQLYLARGKEDADDYYKNIESKRDALIDVNEQLENEYQQYEAIATQIRATMGAYAEYLAAQKTANSGDIYESMSGVSDDLKEAIKLGKIVNDDTQSAVDYVLGGSSAGETYEEQLRRAKEAQEKYKRYFTEDNKGVSNFGSDLVKAGLATNKNGKITLGEGVTGASIMESLGLSQDAVIAILNDLKEYGGQFDWSLLFPELTPEQIEQAGEPSSVINDEATRLVEDAGLFGEAADEAAKIISDGLQEVNDALAGKTPTTPTPSTGESGGVSLFTVGESNESNTPAPVNSESGVVEQTVVVNVVTGEPVSPETILLGVTVSEDGSLSYDVQANASAGVTVGRDALVINVGEDGSYDVFVNGTPGKTISRDSIILGTNTEDGSYTVTANGAAGQILNKQDLVLSLNKDGEWDIVANAKPGVQVKAPELIQGVSEDDDGNLNYKVSVKPTVADGGINATDVLPGVTKNSDGSLSYEVTVVPQTEGTNGSANEEELVAQDNAISKEEQKQKIVIGVYFEMTPDDQETWIGLQEFSDSTLVIPADADPTEAQAAIDAFEGDLKTIIVDVDGDTTEAVNQAAILQRKIEEMNPTMWVTVQKRQELAYASGTKNARRGDALVGERGRELVETNGGYMLVDEPTILPLDEGDRVHKNSDTEKILRRSKNAKANLSPAFAGGSPGGWNTPPSSAKSPKASKSSKTSWQKYFSQLFDWIEIRLDRLSAVTDNWTRQVKNAIGFVNQNKAIDKTIASIGDQIKALQEASKKYQAQADAVAKKTGLGKGVIDKIKNGTIDIDLYSEDKQKKIQEYQKWYEKARETGDAIEDLQDQQKELNNQKLDNISKQYENVRSSIDATYNIAESNLELMKAQGRQIGADDYASMIDARRKNIESLKKEQADLTKEFDAQVASGALKEGSDAWYEYKNRIGELSVELNNANVELIGLNDAVKEIALTNLNYSLDSIREQSAEIQRTLDLIEAQGGEATEELYRNLMAIGKQEIANLNQQNEALQAQLTGLDPMSEKYQEILGKINANKSAIGDAMNSQEQWNDAITDLKIGELQKQKEELSKANDEYQRQLDLNKAIEELERSKSQRKTRILQDGQFKYVADQKDVADKQRDLDQKLHDEEMAKYDKMIEALEDNKKNDNVYPTPGATDNANALAGDMSIAGANQKSGEQSYIAMGLTPMSTQEIFPQIKRDDLAKFTSEFNTLDKKLGDMSSIAMMSNLATMDKGSNLGGMSVQIEPGAIVINASGADANEVFSVFTAKLPNAFEQILHKK